MPTDSINPMCKAHSAPRCGARTRSGKPCQGPAMKGKKRCRRHGGASTGAPGNRNAFKHGHRSKAHLEAMALIRAFQREAMAGLQRD